MTEKASLLVKDATVIDVVAERPRAGQSIWIVAGRIRALGRFDELGAPPSIPVLDARDKYIIPGLMDANLHLMGAIHLEQLARYEGRYEEIITEAAQLTLKRGLTTVFDAWGPRSPLVKVRDRINEGKLTGSRVFCAGNVIGLDGPLSPDFLGAHGRVASSGFAQRINSMWVENTGPELSWMAAAEVGRQVRTYLDGGVDFINYSATSHTESAGGGAFNSAFFLFSPHAQRCIVEEAHRAGVVATAHTTSIESLRAAVEAGCDIIQHGNITGPVPIPTETLKMLVDKQIAVVLFPFTRRRTELRSQILPASTHRFWASGDANCRVLAERGVKLLLGTDAIVQPPSEDNLMELGEGHFHWLKAMEEKGLPPMKMLQAATRNIAVAYGKDKDLGTLEEGKIADMLILNRNPLEGAKNYRAIDAVIKDGEIVATHALPTTPVLTESSPFRA